MSKYGFFVLLGLLATGLTMSVSADVPPEPGSKRANFDLVLVAGEVIPGYRFFVRSGSDLKEIDLKNGERQTIKPLGGGAWYRVGTVLAVPAKSLAGLSDITVEGSRLNELQKVIYDGKVPGTIELLTHQFIRDVSRSGDFRTTETIYRIEPDIEKGVRAVLIAGVTGEQESGAGPDFNIYSNDVKSPIFWVSVVGASLMTLALITFGVWYVRRSKAGTN